MGVVIPQREVGYAAPTEALWPFGGGFDELTPELRWPLDLEVYDRMRRTDTQVKSVLRAVTMPILRAKWRIAPSGARDEVVEHVATDLGLPIAGTDAPPGGGRSRDRFAWGDYLRHSLLDLVFGHMAFEQVASIDDAGRAHLAKLAPRMPRTIAAWDIAPDGGLRAIVQEPPMIVGGIAGLGIPAPSATSATAKRINVSRLVVHSNEREAGNWRGQSMLRSAYKFWLLKDRLLRVQAATIERNGLGVPVYEAAPRESDLGPGLELAQAWRAGETAGAAVKNGAKLRLVGVEGTLPDAEPVIRYYDEQIARAFLAHFLNLGQARGTGSWALGSTLGEFFTLSLQTIAEQRCEVTNQHVIEDLVDWNWGPDEPAPRLVFDEIGSRHPATAEALSTLITCGGLQADTDLEVFLRQQYGLPVKGDDPRPLPSGAQAPPEPSQSKINGGGSA